MGIRRLSIGSSERKATLAGPVAALAAALFVTSLALAQEAPRTAEEDPGFFGSIGRWFDQQASKLGAGFTDARRKVETFGHEAGVAARSTAEGAKDAADAVARIPNARVVTGHEKCRVAANGAPDCIVAASAMCKTRGFETGKSLDMTTAEECSARAWSSGRKNAGDCKTVTFVSRALCQ